MSCRTGPLRVGRPLRGGYTGLADDGYGSSRWSGLSSSSGRAVAVFITMFVNARFARNRSAGHCVSGSAAAQFFGFEDNEVFVKGLQGSVGETCGAVENGSAHEHHVEPFEKWAAGHAVEESLLMKAASVEVGVAQGSAQGWVLQALVADD